MKDAEFISLRLASYTSPGNGALGFHELCWNLLREHFVHESIPLKRLVEAWKLTPVRMHERVARVGDDDYIDGLPLSGYPPKLGKTIVSFDALLCPLKQRPQRADCIDLE